MIGLFVTSTASGTGDGDGLEQDAFGKCWVAEDVWIGVGVVSGMGMEGDEDEVAVNDELKMVILMRSGGRIAFWCLD